VDNRTDILEFECTEPEGTVVRTVTPTKLSAERLGFLWEKLSEFDVLFNDFVNGDLRAFISHFIVQVDGELKPTGLFWDVDDVGILLLKEMIPLQSAEAHFVFWDRRFRGRENLCRGMLKHVFDQFKFERIEVRVPLYAQDTILAVERLGFVKEGRLRRCVPYKGDWFGVNIYSVLPDEVEGDFSITNSQGRNARHTTCMECGNKFDAAIKKRKIMRPVKRAKEVHNDRA